MKQELGGMHAELGVLTMSWWTRLCSSMETASCNTAKDMIPDVLKQQLLQHVRGYCSCAATTTTAGAKALSRQLPL